jgi:hypothetical protein
VSSKVVEGSKWSKVESVLGLRDRDWVVVDVAATILVPGVRFIRQCAGADNGLDRLDVKRW